MTVSILFKLSRVVLITLKLLRIYGFVYVALFFLIWIKLSLLVTKALLNSLLVECLGLGFLTCLHSNSNFFSS